MSNTIRTLIETCLPS